MRDFPALLRLPRGGGQLVPFGLVGLKKFFSSQEGFLLRMAVLSKMESF